MISWHYRLYKAILILVSQYCLYQHMRRLLSLHTVSLAHGHRLCSLEMQGKQRSRIRISHMVLMRIAVYHYPGYPVKEVLEHMRQLPNVLNIPKGMSISEVLSPELKNFIVFNLLANWAFCNQASIRELRKEALRGTQT